MKKYSLKKSLVALSLASAISFNLVGCTTTSSSGSRNNSVNESQTETLNQFLIEDYYFVIIDGDVYFTTRELNDREDYFDYYDANSGKFIGRILRPLQGEVLDHLTTTTTTVYNAKYYDFNYFNGEYGLEKLIPKCAFVPLAQLLSGTTFTQEDFDYFTSNSDDLKRQLQSFGYYTSYAVEDNPIAWRIPFSDVKGGCKVVEEATLRRYDCELNDGTKVTYVGYLCSYNESDSGYNYIYDILTGSIVYIGFGQKNNISSMEVSDYNNDEHKSVLEMINDISSTAKVSDTDNSDNNLVTFAASELYVLDSQSSAVINATDNIKKYYFLVKTNEKIKIEDLSEDIYRDIYQMEADANISTDTLVGTYFNPIENELVTFVGSDDNKPLRTINEFLVLNGLESLIKTSYSLEDISEIKELVSTKESQKQYTY